MPQPGSSRGGAHNCHDNIVDGGTIQVQATSLAGWVKLVKLLLPVFFGGSLLRCGGGGVGEGGEECRVSPVTVPAWGVVGVHVGGGVQGEPSDSASLRGGVMWGVMCRVSPVIVPA